jgi:hypothetical protein
MRMCPGSSASPQPTSGRVGWFVANTANVFDLTRSSVLAPFMSDRTVRAVAVPGDGFARRRVRRSTAGCDSPRTTSWRSRGSLAGRGLDVDLMSAAAVKAPDLVARSEGLRHGGMIRP